MIKKKSEIMSIDFKKAKKQIKQTLHDLSCFIWDKVLKNGPSQKSEVIRQTLSLQIF